MLCEKSRIIKARSPPARILEILSFSKFNREDNFFADNQVHICGRHDKRNRGNGRILHAIRRTGATGKAQPLERNAAAYLIGKLKRKRDRFCKSCRRSSFRSHTTRGRKANTSRIAVFPCCFFFSPLPFFPVCTGDVGKTTALEEKSRRCRFMRTDESRAAAARILMFRK